MMSAGLQALVLVVMISSSEYSMDVAKGKSQAFWDSVPMSLRWGLMLLLMATIYRSMSKVQSILGLLFHLLFTNGPIECRIL